MIAVDTNILVAFHRTEYAHHAVAVDAVTALAEGTGRWAIPWPCVHEFLAVVTNARIFIQPTEPETALKVLEALMASPTLNLVGEGPGYWERLRSLLEETRCVGPRIHDARIAALCLHHGVNELWTADRDFSRFAELRTRNPC